MTISWANICSQALLTTIQLINLFVTTPTNALLALFFVNWGIAYRKFLHGNHKIRYCVGLLERKCPPFGGLSREVSRLQRILPYSLLPTINHNNRELNLVVRCLCSAAPTPSKTAIVRRRKINHNHQDEIAKLIRGCVSMELSALRVRLQRELLYDHSGEFASKFCFLE